MIGLPRNIKKYLCLGLDVFLLPFSLWAAFALTYNSWWPSQAEELIWLFPVNYLIALPLFVHFGLYRAVHRYVSEKFFAAIIIAVILHLAALALITANLAEYPPPWSLFVIYGMNCLGTVGGSRWLALNLLTRSLKARRTPTRVIIYGAGAAGAGLADTLKKGHEYEAVAIIDDKAEAWGRVIFGLKIYPTSELTRLIDRYGAQQVLLAIPSASRYRRRQVLEFLEKLSIQIKTVPAMKDIISGKLSVSDIHEVDVEELLGRDPVAPDDQLLSKCIRGKAVMVTGAAGSIGSELVREIIHLEPSRIVLYEMSEPGLYQIDKELREYRQDNGGNLQNIEIIPVLGTVLDEARLRTILNTFRVQTVYHAAAYKHVPLVESNPVSGVFNNVFGTWRAARAALESGVETFVFISTDKAVRPTNVMGASKRVAELLLQGLAQQFAHPRFCIVRFGNVLASSGSVVPLFKEQIRHGGPVTVTHHDIIRYFMTIPEAAQLVIQAGALSNSGDVCVLDMGEPVSIMEMARKMIALSGLTVKDEQNPNGDIAVEVTGLRPGEKLYEELLVGGDNIVPTVHSRIMRAHEESLPWTYLMELLKKLEEGCRKEEVENVREILQLAVAGYKPQCEIVDPVWTKINHSEGQAVSA